MTNDLTKLLELLLCLSNSNGGLVGGNSQVESRDLLAKFDHQKLIHKRSHEPNASVPISLSKK